MNGEPMGSAASAWVRGARSETGYVRKANEDRMGWTPTAFGDVYVVSDGMGGHLGGALAAELTVRSLQEALAKIPPDSLRFADGVREAFAAANEEVHSRRNPNDPETCEMGATAVALITSDKRFMVAHVGDSRAYLWRRASGLRQLTRDHTRVQRMMDGGLLTPEQAAVHPDASLLDRAVGHQPSVQADVSDWMAVDAGDRILLCSDGLCGYVSDEEIARVLSAAEDPQRATDRLIECALIKGGEDNVTVQLIGYQRSGGWLSRFVPPSRGTLWTSLISAALGAALAGGGVAAWLFPKLDRVPADTAVRPAAEPAAVRTPAVPGQQEAQNSPTPTPTPMPTPDRGQVRAPGASPTPAGPRVPEAPGAGVPEPGAPPLPQIKPPRQSGGASRQGAKEPPKSKRLPPPSRNQAADASPGSGSSGSTVEADAASKRPDIAMPDQTAPTVPAPALQKPTDAPSEVINP
ncbi:protein phosphatase 2C domain-containing protein [Variovorax sp. J22R115]|uniref:protein phosphatase 2C domain-containing protein n=1 Tax=Variovorax sp. J22R115 TaxID=3053509 RepID=UPI0025769808|nr:protein phosphatase 2C domain-containing protein [Variovorax sp. J22R115]MDM0047935.1 protein phosphatase 2C domain-containing protein [Variovorax sp. J22R115]